MTSGKKMAAMRFIWTKDFTAPLVSVGTVTQMDKLQFVYTSDVVNVVRCKDCKFGKLCIDVDGHRLIQCTNTKYPTANVETWPLELDWYCAGGERRDGDT